MLQRTRNSNRLSCFRPSNRQCSDSIGFRRYAGYTGGCRRASAPQGVLCDHFLFLIQFFSFESIFFRMQTLMSWGATREARGPWPAIHLLYMIPDSKIWNLLQVLGRRRWTTITRYCDFRLQLVTYCLKTAIPMTIIVIYRKICIFLKFVSYLFMWFPLFQYPT